MNTMHESLHEPAPHIHYYHTAFAATSQQQSRLHRDEIPPPPRFWKDLGKHRFGREFELAAAVEYATLSERSTFEHIPRNTATSLPIPLMWVFTYKYDNNGFLSSFKARLVVRGDLQDASEKDTYAATLAARAFRCVMSLVAAFDLDTWQADASSAFTNSYLDETVYVECPDGFARAGQCILLRRALYGLRRSPILWFNHLTATLAKFGLRQIADEDCLWASNELLVFFYVDDIVACSRKSNNTKLAELRAYLLATYEMKEFPDLEWFLGIRIIRDRENRKLWLCQDSQIAKIASQHNLENYRRVYTPLSTSVELASNKQQATPSAIHLYQRKIGAVGHPSVMTRPDISFAVSKLAKFLTNPAPEHERAADQLIAYLYQTRHLAIEYSSTAPDISSSTVPGIPTPAIVRASDASFADDPITRYSSEGYIFKLFGGPIDWKATRQRSVTKSSTEAELVALSHAASESMRWQRLFNSLQLDLDIPHTLECDNAQTIRILSTHGPQLQTKLKHVDIHHLWLRQQVQRKEIEIKWTPTAAMIADGFTKALDRQKHEKFVEQIGLVDITHQISYNTMTTATP
jgi:hypothetical protein